MVGLLCFSIIFSHKFKSKVLTENRIDISGSLKMRKCQLSIGKHLKQLDEIVKKYTLTNKARGDSYQENTKMNFYLQT